MCHAHLRHDQRIRREGLNSRKNKKLMFGETVSRWKRISLDSRTVDIPGTKIEAPDCWAAEENSLN